MCPNLGDHPTATVRLSGHPYYYHTTDLGEPKLSAQKVAANPMVTDLVCIQGPLIVAVLLWMIVISNCLLELDSIPKLHDNKAENPALSALVVACCVCGYHYRYSH